MGHARRVMLLLVTVAGIVPFTAPPAGGHGTWTLTVNPPVIEEGLLLGSVNSRARFEIDPNHYRLAMRVQLQATNPRTGEWEVVDTTTDSNIQTCCIQVNAGTACLMPGGGVRLATFYRTRLVYVRVFTQSGALHTERENIYRPPGMDIDYASFCSPI